MSSTTPQRIPLATLLRRGHWRVAMVAVLLVGFLVWRKVRKAQPPAEH